MKFTIGKKLIIGFLSIAVFFGAISAIFYYYIAKVNDSYSDLINRRVQILSNAKNIQVLAIKQTNSLRGYLLTQSPDFIIELRTASAELNHHISEMKYLVTLPESKDTVSNLESLNQEFQKKYEVLLSIYQNKDDQNEALNYFMKEVLPIGMQLEPLAQLITNSNQQLMDEGIEENTQLVEKVKASTFLLCIFAFLCTVMIGFLISRNITRNLFEVTKVISGVTSDFKEAEAPRIEVHSRDEIADIAQAFNKMAKSLKEKSWLEKNIAEMATMYQGIHDLKTLARQFITKITPMVGADYGAFYVKRGTGDEEGLHKLAAYADGRESDSLVFRLGEGLVGQAALENRMMMLTDIPGNHVQITSGMGKFSPSSLIIQPVEFQGEVIAVIELASLKPMSKIQQMLLKQVLSHMGITIDSVTGRMKIEHLLSEAKALTDELQVQSEELQLQQEELKSINDKLEEQYKHAEQRSKELEKTKMELEDKAVQLALSSQYKSEFLANMSHELRTPLNSLLILSRLLIDNEDGNLTAKQVEFASTIHSSGNDLLQLINDILDLSKIESGKIDMIPAEVNLDQVCSFMKRQFLPIADEKGVGFAVQLDAGLRKTIFTDEHRLLQILRNLLSNAFKFTEKGQVTLHIRETGKDTLAKHPELAFTVKDTGIGIAKDQQSIIFEAFQQGDGKTSRKYGGTGLGLSISREIAQLLGGKIDVESVAGQGSSFTFYLPMPEAERPAAEISNPEVAAARSESPAIDGEDILSQDRAPFLKGKKILIVDDDMRNIFAITAALEKKQMKVFFAENGRQALNVLGENPDIDLVLMDIMMPEIDGFEAMRTIRSMPHFQTLPIIALTAKAMKNDREKCMEAGASDYISKPVKLEQLFSLMQVWLYDRWNER
ncbi:ATP-binding protein [Ammoniphilus sp. 3BR4]|uniref:ATP-binding protein n=1 Tax=Ammoniphilus sp. 3BR4 TaxID=3158265 RepID=UPI0034656DDC